MFVDDRVTIFVSWREIFLVGKLHEIFKRNWLGEFLAIGNQVVCLGGFLPFVFISGVISFELQTSFSILLRKYHLDKVRHVLNFLAITDNCKINLSNSSDLLLGSTPNSV